MAVMAFRRSKPFPPPRQQHEQRDREVAMVFDVALTGDVMMTMLEERQRGKSLYQSQLTINVLVLILISRSGCPEDSEVVLAGRCLSTPLCIVYSGPREPRH
jgi:hypothetical protein